MNLEKLHRIKLPKTLWHYTDKSGLLGIIENKSLWATNINYLNDSSEFKKSCDIVKDIFTDRLSARLKHTRKNQAALKSLQKKIDDLEIEKLDIYVFSFSKVKDSLSQWRAYGKNCGYCIGFNSKFVRTAISTSINELLPCIYKKKDQTSLMQDIIDKAIPLYEKTKQGALPSVGEINFILRIFRYGPLLKDAAFKDEKEWRLVLHNDFAEHEFGFREGNPTIIPYCKLKLDGEHHFSKFIDGINIGPTAEFDLAESAIAKLALHKGLHYFNSDGVLTSHLKITRSKIPYRTW